MKIYSLLFVNNYPFIKQSPYKLPSIVIKTEIGTGHYFKNSARLLCSETPWKRKKSVRARFSEYGGKAETNQPNSIIFPE